jgi:hypothetical protein
VASSDWTFANEREEHAFLEEGQVFAEIATRLHVEGIAKAEIVAQARAEEKDEGQTGADNGATVSAKHKSVQDDGDKSVLDDGDKSVLDDGEAGMKTGGSARGAKQKVGRKKEAVPRGGTKREMSKAADDAATKITAVGALDADGGLTHQYKEYLRANRLQIVTPADEKSTAALYKVHVSSAPEDLLVVRTHQYQRDLVRIFALIAAAGVEAFGIIRIYGFRGDAKWEPQDVDCIDCSAALQSAFTTFRTHQYEDVLKMVQRLQPDAKCRGFIGIAGKITAWFKEYVGVELAIIAEITGRIEEAIQTKLRSGAT